MMGFLPSPDGPSKGGEENRAVWLEGREGEQGDSPAQLGRHQQPLLASFSPICLCPELGGGHLLIEQTAGLAQAELEARP